MLTIVGGTYIEICHNPLYEEIFGSGLRAAFALSKTVDNIEFISCIGHEETEQVLSICKNHQIKGSFTNIEQTITFSYVHPLKSPKVTPDLTNHVDVLMPEINATNVLYYGMAEACPRVTAEFVVYDPQSWVSFGHSGSYANHLALVLNYKEAIYFSGLNEDAGINEIGNFLRKSENAEVVVIKNGSDGALVFEGDAIFHIPVFETKSVWPIGSGDVFSACFAWNWMIQKKSAKESALIASQYTAHYCETRNPVFETSTKERKKIDIKKHPKKIYLAGPFFTTGDRWLIEEVRNILTDFGNTVFSPLHNVGLGTSKSIAKKDLKGLEKSSIVFAIVNGLDAGTLFEIGYAKALGKEVIVLAQNVNKNNLLMLRGTGCFITDDLSTAVYRVSW